MGKELLIKGIVNAFEHGKLSKGFFHTKPPKIGNIEGLNLRLLKSDGFVHVETENPTIKALLDMGIKRSDAEILFHTASPEVLLKSLKFYKDCGSLDKAVPDMIKEYNMLCRKFERNLNFSGRNYYTPFSMDADIPNLTHKYRMLRKFQNGDLKCKQLPEELIMTEAEKAEKALVDKTFKEIEGTEFDLIQYRGEQISEVGESRYFKQLTNTKEGEIFEIPGYAYTTDCAQYAFGYANGEVESVTALGKWNIKHHILCPKDTKILLSRSRLGQEFILPCDSKMRLIKRIINKENRTISIYSEHIP